MGPPIKDLSSRVKRLEAHPQAATATAPAVATPSAPPPVVKSPFTDGRCGAASAAEAAVKSPFADGAAEAARSERGPCGNTWASAQLTSWPNSQQSRLCPYAAHQSVFGALPTMAKPCSVARRHSCSHICVSKPVIRVRGRAECRRVGLILTCAADGFGHHHVVRNSCSLNVLER